MKVYQSYIVNTMLPAAGILNEEAIDKSDLTYKAWAEEETISLQEFLTYAASQNWIDISRISPRVSGFPAPQITFMISSSLLVNSIDIPLSVHTSKR